MPLNKDFNVAIVGGGMSGLVCAIALLRAGITVDVFEAASKFGEVGAGVGLGPNAIRALQELRMLEAVLTKAHEAKPVSRPFLFVSGIGDHELIYDFPALPTDLGLGVYRPAFLDALTPLVDLERVHFGKRCIEVSPLGRDKHTLTFADGTIHEANLVIGADGIKSVIRAFVAPSDRLVFTNTVAYRGLIPMEDLLANGFPADFTRRPVCWAGENKHIISYPIQGGQMMNVAAFVTNKDIPYGSVELPAPWVEDVPVEELFRQYDDWGPSAKLLLQHVKETSKWSIHAINPPLTTFISQRVVLVGDAAHAMLPHLGAGAGQGIEDVFALCSLLTRSRVEPATLETTLRVYDIIRTARANMVLQNSRGAGEIYESYQSQQDKSEFQQRVFSQWDPVWHFDLAYQLSLL